MRTHPSRRGGALVIAFIIAMGMAAMLLATTERWTSTTALGRFQLDRQRAAAAAEAVTSMIESKLLSESFEQLTTPIDSSPQMWWNLRGALYLDKNQHRVVPTTGLWINGSLVTWGIEPVKLLDKTSDSASGYDFINPPNDGDIDAWKVLASTGGKKAPDQLTDPKEVGYHFRVIAEAYAMKDPGRSDGQPWIRGDRSQDRYVASAQVTRIIQIKPTQLFRYALIHLGSGPDADLDLQAAGGINIQKGNVHSNGVLTMISGMSGGLSRTDYHGLASGDEVNSATGKLFGNNGRYYFGTAAQPIQVTAYNGIYRTSKQAVYFAYLHGATTIASSTDFGKIPLIDPATDPAVINNLNGDVKNPATANNNRVSINGTVFTMANDSRTPVAMRDTFKSAVKDSKSGAPFVNFLQNFPQLGGWPLEHQNLSQDGNVFIGAGGQLTLRSTGVQAYYQSLPINPRLKANYLQPAKLTTAPAPGVPVAQASEWTQLTMQPLTIASTLLPQGISAAVTAYPVKARDLPLWYTDSSFNQTDIICPDTLYDSQTPVAQNRKVGFLTQDAASGGAPATRPVKGTNDVVTIDASSLWGTGFSIYEAKSYYLSRALFHFGSDNTVDPAAQYYSIPSQPASRPDFLGFTGLVIRETPFQRQVDWTTKRAGGTMRHTLTIHGDKPASSAPTRTRVSDATTVCDTIAWPNGLNTGSDDVSSAGDGEGGHVVSLISDKLPTRPTPDLYAPEMVADGDRATFYESTSAGSGWVGIDMGTGNRMKCTRIRFCPRATLASRMLLGRFEWADAPTGPWTLMNTLIAAPPEGVMTEIAVAPGAHRCFRYYGPPTGYCNIAELQFLDDQTAPLTDYRVRPNRYDPLVQPGAGSIEQVVHQVRNARDRIAMVRYLCSNYNVLFMGRNITGEFFSQLLGAADYDDMLATEDQFVDQRESAYYSAAYGTAAGTRLNPQNYPLGSGGPSFASNPGTPAARTNALTINLQALMTWFKTTTMASLGIATASGTLARDHFNGLMYVHRTRRSLTEHQIFCPQFRWTAHTESLDDPALPALVKVAANYPFLFNHLFSLDLAQDNGYAGGVVRNYPWNWREASGPPDTFLGAVRLKGGTIDDQKPAAYGASIYNTATDDDRRAHGDVNWGHDGATPAALGTSGFTFITPNRFYLWGDFNTQSHKDPNGVDQVTPCAIWSDVANRQSPNWHDYYRKQMYDDGKWQVWQVAAAWHTVRTSWVLTNVPINSLTAWSQGGSTYETFIRCNENNRGGPGGFDFTGSMVLLRESRYAHSDISYNNDAWCYLNSSIRTFCSPNYNLYFNTDLFKSAGQPPFSPYGAEAKRIVNLVNIYDH